MSKVSVIGAGSWGTALSILLAKKGLRVSIWDRNDGLLNDIKKARENIKYLPGVIIPQNVEVYPDIIECIKDTDLIVLGVPSHAIREICKNIKGSLNDGQKIVSIAKGIENDTYLRMSQVIEEETGINDVCVLSGPSHAEEVSRDIPTTVVVSSRKRTVAEYVQDIFMTPKFRVYTNPDITGVELGGAIKNIIALAAGISDGLGYGDNTKAALMTRGLAEMTRLGVAMGADTFTFSGLSGIGDLIVTCTSMHSRNRRAGILIGQGKSVNEALTEVKMVVEGVKTTKAAYELSKRYQVEMPITEKLYEVLFQDKNPKYAVTELMLREKTIELHENEEVVTREQKSWEL
ncbi:glycerol-3-phosphate dehydrogenase [NAD(P)+] [Oxobacter pfennigii]|uniref:Glycerol-3-phosphate dehydrogenase [NAD(P)+] n=1 Tax=Oxobacter pfennigii TaxID=36849 RepID=A0A0P8W5Q1_9CLOT|nr:NAD(P)H-dependent glycerol-3-phosphate dehydrogenase [Oxobacter pfennigii]KPU44015.1 glycerol-3-phosphate dehydrogenase [NAD(P)+] [Oxobacter pfennigii]